MPTLTAARSGLARSGATRSGYPVLQGTKVPLYALSGIARSGATRSNYHQATAYVLLGGSRVSGLGGRIIQAIEVHETLGQPATARFRLMGMEPALGQDVVITLGSINNTAREFAGQVLGSDLTYFEKPATNYSYDVHCIDYTWGLNKRKVRARYLNATVAVIAADLIATYTAGYTLQVAADIGAQVLDEITFTEQDVTDALKQLTGRVGGSWVCDYTKVVRLFFEDVTGSSPVTINAVHRTLTRIALAKDLSQVLTRVTMEGGGPNSAAWVAAGETLLPLEGDPGWFQTAGGVVVSGPQRITYGGVSVGGGGLLVGPGAAPSGSPNVALVSGVGVTAGVHLYAVSYVTATGESLPGPTVSVTTGVHDSPSTLPTVGAPTIGTGPDPGLHLWGVSFLTASGETILPGTVAASTGLTDAPETAPVPGTPQLGAGVDDGVHDYAVTFVSNGNGMSGETTPSPIGSSVVVGPLAPPGPLTVGAGTAGTGPEQGSHEYAVTFVTAAGETTPGPSVTKVTDVSAAPLSAIVATEYLNPIQAANQWLIGDAVSYVCTYVTAIGETVAGPVSNTIIATSADPGGPLAVYPHAITLSSIPVPSDPAVTSKRVYRKVNGSWAGYLVMPTLGTTTHGDHYEVPTTPTAGSPPSTATATLRVNHLTGIPTGPSGTTSRTVYRTTAGGSPLKLLTTLAGNSSTTYTDSTVDASLGATAPTSNTAAANVIPLSQIPRGDANVVYRNLYRRSAGMGLKLLGSILNNTATTFTDAVPNASLGAAVPTVSSAYLQRFHLTNIPKGDSLVTGRRIYRTVAGGAVLKVVGDLANNTATTFEDWTPDASLGAAHPGTNTATTQQVALSSIPIGASAVTQRKVYRTAAGFAQLKLLTTLADNTTQTYPDTTADGSLGANAPTIDTSGLTQPSGSIPQGATTIIIATTAAFSPSGGWALIGNGAQCVRYTGLTLSSLTGIPASGPGSIQASISYNSTATVPPVLTGIPASGTGSIRYPIPKGDPVNLFVQVDDLAAQAALAALIGGDGVQVDHLQDRRLSMTETTARATAWLQLKREVLLTVRYTVRDRNSRPGRRVLINLGAPFNLLGVEFLIQSVTETALAVLPNLPPTFDVVASSTRFTFDDLLRLIKRVT